jgi:hypothetical protein
LAALLQVRWSAISARYGTNSLMIPYDHARAESLRIASSLAAATHSSAIRAVSTAVRIGVAASMLEAANVTLVDAQAAADHAGATCRGFLAAESERVAGHATTLADGRTG